MNFFFLDNLCVVKYCYDPDSLDVAGPPPADNLCFFIASSTPAKFAVFFFADVFGVVLGRTLIVGFATSSMKSNSLFLLTLKMK